MSQPPRARPNDAGAGQRRAFARSVCPTLLFYPAFSAKSVWYGGMLQDHNGRREVGPILDRPFWIAQGLPSGFVLNISGGGASSPLDYQPFPSGKIGSRRFQNRLFQISPIHKPKMVFYRYLRIPISQNRLFQNFPTFLREVMPYLPSQHRWCIGKSSLISDYGNAS